MGSGCYRYIPYTRNTNIQHSCPYKCGIKGLHFIYYKAFVCLETNALLPASYKGSWLLLLGAYGYKYLQIP